MSGKEIWVEGINVQFPFEPYNCQMELMRRVISCLEQGANAVLESPTGTGKTVALLCSTIAWLKSRRPTEIQSVVAAPESGKKDKPPGRTQILYASRTHAQLSQVIKELNKTAYKDIQVCFLGSRDQLCVHPQVSQERESTIKNYLCRSKNSHHHLFLRPDRVPDIEDLVQLGRRHEFCPFFKTREGQEEADLILMPYNYLLDPTTRRLNKVSLRGSILIFDEAHNLEKICEETASFSFKSTDFATALKEARGALKMLLDERETLRQTMEDTEAPFGTSSSLSRGSALDVDLNDLSHLILLLEGLEERLNEELLPKLLNSPDGSTVALPGSALQELLSGAHFRADLCEGISVLADQVSSYLTAKAESSVWANRGLALQKFARLVNIVYSNSSSSGIKSKFVTTTDLKDFKVYLCSEKVGVDGAPKDKAPSFIVNYWCFSAGYSMSALLSHQVHSVIVTSGTLSPIDSFVNEMRIPFPIRMEGAHVVERTHFQAYICSHGPDGTTLNGSYANRSNEKYVGSLGNSIVNLCRIVPQGLLVFFSSYSQLDSCMEHWKNGAILKRIERLKKVFVEPRHKEKFADILSEYRKFVEDGMQPNGAVFFCVMRGKVSEGFDFADRAARAVVIVGIPFPPAFDPRVRLKKEYLNGLTKSKQCHVDGETWYVLEAVRAVNQAIGRVIRHKDDFGAIILADCRFSDWPLNRFPCWLRSSITSIKHFGDIVRALSSFFKHHSLSAALPAKRGIEVVEEVAAENTSAFYISRSVYSSQESGTDFLKDDVSESPSNETVWSSLQTFYSSGAKRAAKEQASTSVWETLASYSFSKESTFTDVKRNSVVVSEVVPDQCSRRKVIRLKPTPEVSPGCSSWKSQGVTSDLQHQSQYQCSSAADETPLLLADENVATLSKQTTSKPSCDSDTLLKARCFVNKVQQMLPREVFFRLVKACKKYSSTKDILSIVDFIQSERSSLNEAIIFGLKEFVRPTDRALMDEVFTRAS
uniref:Regulator of telomere elongation helicase 1 homolog n=1 Tax=Trichuris muris TaxID=70415 RepID=A0A5S6R2Y3_TRIMR